MASGGSQEYPWKMFIPLFVEYQGRISFVVWKYMSDFFLIFRVAELAWAMGSPVPTEVGGTERAGVSLSGARAAG